MLNLSLQSPTCLTKSLALKELSNYQDIIIRPADKGGAVAVLTKDKYIKEACHQLDTKHYESSTV